MRLSCAVHVRSSLGGAEFVEVLDDNPGGAITHAPRPASCSQATDQPGWVLSHETALDLYELCDVNPAHIDVTVPRGYRTHRPLPAPYRLHRRDLTNGEATRLLRGLPIVTPLRAIIDGIEAHVRGELIEQAIHTAEQQSLITRDDAASAHDAYAARHAEGQP